MADDSIGARLDDAVELMVEIASGELSARGEVSDRGDQVDALVAGLNMLAEELDSETVARQHAEELLRDERHAYETVPGLLCSVDSVDLEVIKCNQTLALAVGSTKEKLVGRSILELCVPAQRPTLEGVLRGLAVDATSTGAEFLLIEPDGRLNVEMRATRVRDAAGGERLRVLFHDITERKRAAEDKATLEEKLRQAQKMESIGRLAGGVAHDFNNMLCAITGFASLGRLDLPDDDPLAEPLDEIAKAADRAAELTAQLLAFSRQQVIAPKVVALDDLIERMHTMLSRLIGEDIVLRIVNKEPLGSVSADPSQVEQVVLNLALNARDAMRDGGELIIETANVELDDAYGQSHAHAKPGLYIMLAVTDSGIGMDADTRAKVFEPFFTTKEQGRGTGLGLATVFGIVQQSGGRIEVYSEPNEGTCFKVYFPRVPERADALAAPSRIAARGGSETVLIVEDDELVRAFAAKALARLGYDVLRAASGAEAISLAEQHERPIDLLFTDVVMPRMNGRDLAERLAEMGPAMKVLFTSGYTQDVIVHHNVLMDGIEFLAKPYAHDSLATRVREVLDGS